MSLILWEEVRWKRTTWWQCVYMLHVGEVMCALIDICNVSRHWDLGFQSFNLTMVCGLNQSVTEGGDKASRVVTEDLEFCGATQPEPGTGRPGIAAATALARCMSDSTTFSTYHIRRYVQGGTIVEARRR